MNGPLGKSPIIAKGVLQKPSNWEDNHNQCDESLVFSIITILHDVFLQRLCIKDGKTLEEKSATNLWSLSLKHSRKCTVPNFSFMT